MKKLLLFFVVVLVISSVMPLGAQDKRQTKAERKSEEALKVKNGLEARDFTLVVDQVNPMGMRSVRVTSDFTLRIKGDSVISNLPYFGRAYSIPYGGGDGLRFVATAMDYKVSEGKRGATEITFWVRTREDRFEFRLSVYPEGTGSVYVQSNNRQAINYNVHMDLYKSRPGSRE